VSGLPLGEVQTSGALLREGSFDIAEALARTRKARLEQFKGELAQSRSW
jgi:hypothetical protein